MKALYIIAWVGLALSVIVHFISILGPEDIFSGIDGLVWILHGGAILLGLPAVLCAQKIIVGTKEKDFWRAVFKNCPSWMRGMVGFFFFYGIINFILFMSSNKGATSTHGTPTGIFKGFSGHWMIFYSIEVAIFHSYLKNKFSDVAKKSLSDHILPGDKKSHRQLIKLFLIAGCIFSILLWLAFKGYPWFLGCAMFSLFPFAAVQAIYAIYSGLRGNIYLQKNYFEIWKKGKSVSLADRVEFGRLVKELDDPYLKSLNFKATRFSEICFWVWLIVLGLVLTGLALFVQPK